MMKTIGMILSSAILLFAFGCNHSGPITVSGTVTVDDQPLERGKIDFQPADDKGPTAATTITGGKYECPVVPGKKKIRISGGKVTGKHAFTPGNPASPMVEDIKSLVPSCYNTETTLSCEVSYGTSEYDFKLKSKP
jgi:hypothetical protein